MHKHGSYDERAHTLQLDCCLCDGRRGASGIRRGLSE